MQKKEAKRERRSIALLDEDWCYCIERSEEFGISASKYIEFLIREDKEAENKLTINREE